MNIKPLKFTLYSTKKNYSISSSECKDDILCKLNKLFDDKENYNIFCTKHNIVVEHTEVPCYSYTKMIVRFVFNIEGRLVYALINDLDLLELSKIEFNGHTIHYDSIVKDIRLHKDSYMDAMCGYYRGDADGIIPEDALEDDSNIKLCHEDDTRCCSSCQIRSARRLYINSVGESNHLEYKMDKVAELIMYEYPEAEGIMNDKYSYTINREDNIMVDNISLLSKEEQEYYYSCTFDYSDNSVEETEEAECYDVDDDFDADEYVD